MKAKSAIIIAVVVGVAIGIWYYFASKTYHGYLQEFQNMALRIDTLRSTFQVSGQIKNEIRLEDVASYIGAYKNLRQNTVHIQDDLMGGKGMGFWFPTGREESSVSIGAFLLNEDTVLNHAESAVNNLTGIHTDVVQLLSQGAAERAKAVSILNPESDSRDFRGESEVVSRVSMTFPKMKSKLDAQGRKVILVGLAEKLRLAMLREMVHSISKETEVSIYGRELL